ncbi:MULTISPECIES: tyrosine-type recombinase/integrase [unclassified Bacillus (in: firmicutes)]|uniref:tyrosine-type recombinase/integrase n=1 Tax=unclassified Bacillus (in: firmicutes) TaxID=185979 RepID=UPI0027DFC5B8|nr:MULTISPECIES: tyrosine-type recombinase/integrase [unclassified Bacillus (in: firmicutes)]
MKKDISPNNPAVKIKEPKTGKRIPKFLTEMEIEHLREACYSPMENALFEFMFSTGCRIGEIVTLDRIRINWSNRSAVIRGKGDKEREVYFNIRGEIWLKRYLDNRVDRAPAILRWVLIDVINIARPHVLADSNSERMHLPLILTPFPPAFQSPLSDS